MEVVTMTEMDLQLARIRTKLTTLQKQGWKKHQHQLGVNAHKFVLYPALSESAVATFEREHAIQLPSAYRAFVREISNGGAGPYYGISPLPGVARLNIPPSLNCGRPQVGCLSDPCLINLAM